MELIHSYADLGPLFSTRVKPQPLDTPELVSTNSSVSELLGITALPREDSDCTLQR